MLGLADSLVKLGLCNCMEGRHILEPGRSTQTCSGFTQLYANVREVTARTRQRRNNL